MIDLQNLPGIKPGEQVVYLLRRHWIVPAKLFLLLGMCAIVPFVVYAFLQSQFPDLLANQTLAPILAMLASFYELGVWLILVQEFVDFYLDTWIVTTERVIDISQNGLFNRTSAEVHLANIVDVTSEMKGFFRTVLNYGDVYVQTAAELARFHFMAIAHPDAVRQTVLKLVDDDRERHGHKE